MATRATIRTAALLAGFIAAAACTGLPWTASAGQPGMRRQAAGCTDCQAGRCGHGGCGQRGDCRLCNHCGGGLLGPCCGHCCGHGCGHCGGHWIHHDTIEKRYFLRSQGKSWHSAWYDPAEGRPIALVVPPTAEFMTQYSWGVPSSRVMPLYHQFRRPYPGPGAVAGGGGGFLPTPNQPSDTVQFGISAVRGPWNGY